MKFNVYLDYILFIRYRGKDFNELNEQAFPAPILW